jgi:hypothetical protein
MFQDMTARLGKDPVELNQILNSAIAQHATKRKVMAPEKPFPKSRNSYSPDSAK